MRRLLIAAANRRCQCDGTSFKLHVFEITAIRSSATCTEWILSLQIPSFLCINHCYSVSVTRDAWGLNSDVGTISDISFRLY